MSSGPRIALREITLHLSFLIYPCLDQHLYGFEPSRARAVVYVFDLFQTQRVLCFL